MKQFSKITLLVLGFGLLTAVLSYIPSRPAAAAGAAPVLVTNTGAAAAVPVSYPVTPTVNVGNLPATQPVSGTVSVGNFPTTQPVSFSTTSTTPLFVDTDRPARNAVSGGCNVGTSSSNGGIGCDLVIVPTGEILVIDTLSFVVDVKSGGTVFNTFCALPTLKLGGTQVIDFAPPLVLLGSGATPPNTVAVDVRQWAGATRLYADGTQAGGDANHTVKCAAFTNQFSETNVGLSVSFAGHLVTP